MKRNLIIFAGIFIMLTIFSNPFYSNAAEEVFHGGDIIYTKPLKAVLFSHKYHVEDMGMSCDMCHNGMFEMQALAAQEASDFTMKGLYNGKFCGSCHNGNMAFSADSQCARCHIGVKGFNRMMNKEKDKEKH